MTGDSKNLYKFGDVVVTTVSLVANEAPELARIRHTGVSGAHTIVNNSRILSREALIVGRNVLKLGRDSLQLASVALIYGREAPIRGREVSKVARSHPIAGSDRRIAASNGLIRDRVSIFLSGFSASAAASP